MELEVQKPVHLEDGKYEGIVDRVEHKNVTKDGQEYKYTDIYIRLETENGRRELKYGCPTSVSENTKLGKLLAQFVKLEPGKKVDPVETLTGKKVCFVTVTEEKEGLRYVRIADNSIKPLSELEAISEK